MSLLASTALLSCSEKKSSPSAPNDAQTAVESFKPDEEQEATLSLDKGDEILTLAVNSDGSVSASAKSGAAYVFDTESAEVTKVPSFFKFDPQSTTTLTVNSEYLWVISLNDGTIGRNKLPPDQNKKVEISKVSVSDIFDLEAATPVGASDTQLYLITEDSLAVMTFSGSFINRKKVPIPGGKLVKGEYVVGAGPIGDGTETHWMLTNKRLLRFLDKAWNESPMLMDSGDKEMNLVTLNFKESGEKEEAAHGLLGSDLLVRLVRVQEKSVTTEDTEEAEVSTTEIKKSKSANKEEE